MFVSFVVVLMDERCMTWKFLASKASKRLEKKMIRQGNKILQASKGLSSIISAMLNEFIEEKSFII